MAINLEKEPIRLNFEVWTVKFEVFLSSFLFEFKEGFFGPKIDKLVLIYHSIFELQWLDLSSQSSQIKL